MMLKVKKALVVFSEFVAMFASADRNTAGLKRRDALQAAGSVFQADAARPRSFRGVLLGALVSVAAWGLILGSFFYFH